jgi:hypothetical protein
MISRYLIATLTSDDSAGVQNAARFEPTVYRQLQQVAAGVSAAYGRFPADLDRAAGGALIAALPPTIGKLLQPLRMDSRRDGGSEPARGVT